MFDAHVHSSFSHDGKSTIEEYAKLLDNGIIEGIGFAEHLDYTPDGSGYGIFKYESYKQKVSEFKEKGCSFFAGAEVGFNIQAKDHILEELRKQDYDFTMASVHRALEYSLSTDKSIGYFEDTQLFKNILENYYHAVQCSLVIDDFDAIGHIGIYRRFLNEGFFSANPLTRWIDELEDDLARECAKSDKVIEVNTSGMFSPCASTFPKYSFLQAYHRYGGRYVCLGSDSHSVSKVGMGFAEAKEMLENIGFRYLVMPWNRTEGIKIS